MKRIFIVSIFFVLFFLVSNSVLADAHARHLDIIYDECYPDDYKNETDIGDGYDESWYELIRNKNLCHISDSIDEPTTIKYYFNTTGKYESVSWDLLTNDEQIYIISSYKESMKKWNNVYFYGYASDGSVIKHKLVNIVEGTKEDNNLIIYPTKLINGYAGTSYVGQPIRMDNLNGINHYHYSQWEMYINIALWDSNDKDISENISKRTGAHELGHVLGLQDIDSLESSVNKGEYHHEEILMGYSSSTGSVKNRQTEITYKDLVGVAITRGYHTDDDHMWLYDSSSSSEGKYKLICTICNGVKHVSNLYNYIHLDYKSCGDKHSLDSGNMMAVASYGTKDYYKCKYCRYVAPFTNLVKQNYQYVDNPSNNKHMLKNMVNGLEYNIALEEGMYEEHTYDDYVCTKCGYISHTHDYNESYLWKDYKQHYSNCECGKRILHPHVVTSGSLSGGKRAICLVCGGEASMGFVFSTNNDIEYLTENGTFALPNGVIVLADDDMEAFKNGTLNFNDRIIVEK